MSKEVIQEEQTNDALLQNVKDFWDVGFRNYSRDRRRMNMLDMADRGDLWRALGKAFPAYQILPDTNHVSFVKSNMVASIYTVAKSAEILPTSEEDKEICMQLNVIMDAFWDTQRVGYYQFQAGERAALMNLGITQVGWDEDIVDGYGSNIVKGQVKLKNVNPMKFMRDPYAVDLKSSSWCCIHEHYHKSVFLKNKNYKEAFKAYYDQKMHGDTMGNTNQGPDGIPKSGAKDYYTLITWWVRGDDGKVQEVHTVNNEAILWKRTLKIKQFPFALCYCNTPAEALIGTSEPAKIFANTVAYNLLDSLLLTAEYKNQHPPKFISDQSKLNVRAFSKHGDDADKTFVVAGDATKAVHYHQFPAPSNFVPVAKQSLDYAIQNVTGVDGKYTGRDTGSITTTGGTENMLNRVTLVDTPKIMLYENYVKDLTELILLNFIEFSPKRKFYRKKPNSREYETVEVDFPKVEAKTLFNYRAAISSELPKNKQRIAAMATELLQAQAQYRQEGSAVDWITEEEWLMFQDLPMREFMLERMGIQRRQNTLEDVAQTLYQYGDLMQQGMTSDEAMQATAETLHNQRMGNPTATQTSGQNPTLEAMANRPTV